MEAESPNIDEQSDLSVEQAETQSKYSRKEAINKAGKFADQEESAGVVESSKPDLMTGKRPFSGSGKICGVRPDLLRIPSAASVELASAAPKATKPVLTMAQSSNSATIISLGTGSPCAPKLAVSSRVASSRSVAGSTSSATSRRIQSSASDVDGFFFNPAVSRIS